MKNNESQMMKMQCKCGSKEFTVEVFRMNDQGKMIQDLHLTCKNCGREVRYYASEQFLILAEEI